MAQMVCRCPEHGGEFYFDISNLSNDFVVIWKCEICDFGYIAKIEDHNLDIRKGYLENKHMFTSK